MWLKRLKANPISKLCSDHFGSVHAHRCILSRICVADGCESLHVREREFDYRISYPCFLPIDTSELVNVIHIESSAMLIFVSLVEC